MGRPKDRAGAVVEHGEWYWVYTSEGAVWGAGVFASVDDQWTFYVNGTAYDPDGFHFIPAKVPEFVEPCVYCGREFDPFDMIPPCKEHENGYACSQCEEGIAEVRSRMLSRD